MKCKHCDGVGFFENGASQFKCVYCDGTGEVEMTEQEWLQTASTEKLAEFLSNIEEQYPCGALLKCDVTCGYHSQCRGDDVAPTNKEAWVEWLKQPHTIKE